MGQVLLFLLFLVGVYWMFRKPKKTSYYGQTLGNAPSPYEASKPVLAAERDPDVADLPEKMSLGKRLYGIVFLSVWLSGWSVGCYLALQERLKLSYGDEGYIFLTIWLAIAIPGWFLAVWTLLRLLRGDEVEFNTDGSD